MTKIVPFRRSQPKMGRKFQLRQDFTVFFVHSALLVLIGFFLYINPNANVLTKTAATIFSLLYLTLSVAFHEFGHAYVALKSGDYTVKASGYLELNIFKYMDSQSMFFTLLLFLMTGFFLPAGVVYLSHYHIKSSMMLWVNLAGLIADVITLAVSLVFLHLLYGSASQQFTEVFSAVLVIKIAYIFFNILPIPSLDGYNSLAELAPDRIKENMLQFGAQYGSYIMMFVYLAPSSIFSPVWRASILLASKFGINPSNFDAGYSLIRVF